MAWHENVLPVVRVAIRKREEAINASDLNAQVRYEASLNAMKPGWLANEYAKWVSDGKPPIR